MEISKFYVVSEHLGDKKSSLILRSRGLPSKESAEQWGGFINQELNQHRPAHRKVKVYIVTTVEQIKDN